MEGLLLQAERAILLIFFLSFPLATVVSAQDSLFHICSNNNYSAESNYKSSLSNLLLNLSSEASVKLFSETSRGQNPYEVHGRYLCRGDATHEVCQNCVGNATNTLVASCPNNTGAIIWYDDCLLRFGHRPFFTGLDSSVQWTKCNAQNISSMDVSSFIRVVNNTLMNIAAKTAKGDHLGNKYAYREVKLSEFLTLYEYGQCTPDLSVADCKTCLTESIIWLLETPWCVGRKGGRWYHGTSCYIQYEIFPFYHIPAGGPAPAPAHAASSAGGIKNATLLSPGKKSSHKIIMAIVVPVALATLLVVGIGIHLLSWKLKKMKKWDVSERDADNLVAAESFQYDLVTVQTATNYFCSENKIGEGGFGSVYKGTLEDGQEIAVKRLNKKSNQGAVQFKNEINLLAKLQHKNLVRLLGFYLDGIENLLVYEFVPNKSLNYFLFDGQRKGQLDWPSRYNIIRGIARGMLYLHEDSRLRIIHRDLKVSNILLDMDLNPKISDFGLARIFGMDQTHNKTERIAGTFGYMAPEYITRGFYSMKSDVYSFGVLVLEIISGRKNNSFCQPSGDLLGDAWKCWIDCSALEFMDPDSKASCNSSDELKICLQLGLLCVQKDPDQRPTMARIVQMLNDDPLSTLPVPQHPPFFIESNITDTSSTEKGPILDASSVTGVTITDLEGR